MATAVTLSSLDDLPQELLEEILAPLGISDLGSLANCSKQLQHRVEPVLYERPLPRASEHHVKWYGNWSPRFVGVFDKGNQAAFCKSALYRTWEDDLAETWPHEMIRRDWFHIFTLFWNRDNWAHGPPGDFKCFR